MATETTEPITFQPRPISAQRGAAEALVALTEMFGQLPGGYIKIHSQVTSLPVKLELQLESPQDFEQWRTALAIAPEGVSLHASASYVWLAAEGVFHGVVVDVTGFGVLLAPEQAAASQLADETASAVAA